MRLGNPGPISQLGGEFCFEKQTSPILRSDPTASVVQEAEARSVELPFHLPIGEKTQANTRFFFGSLTLPTRYISEHLPFSRSMLNLKMKNKAADEQETSSQITDPTIDPTIKCTYVNRMR